MVRGSDPPNHPLTKKNSFIHIWVERTVGPNIGALPERELGTSSGSRFFGLLALVRQQRFLDECEGIASRPPLSCVSRLFRTD